MANQKNLNDLMYVYFDLLTASGGATAITAATQEARPTTGAITSVGDAAASTTILAANTARKGAAFYNLSTAILYLNLAGGTATTTTGFTVALAASSGYFELPQPVYTGLVTGIWASDAGGTVNVTEWV